MRYPILLILTALASCQAHAAPVAWFEVGDQYGLSIVSSGDGLWAKRTVSGREAVTLEPGITPHGRYMYFALSPELRQRLGSEAYLVVDYLDEGGGMVGVQYNSPTTPYAGKNGFLLLASGQWLRAMIHLRGARFEGKQNGGADFRLSHGGPITISRVELYETKPDVDIPTDKERIMKTMVSAPQPKDMLYTFGSDADESSAALYKSLGVTGVESYVTWETCERAGEGKWDWSQWDKQVDILKENGLKWTPFLILGPAYSTPGWFRAGSEHYPCRCLEHGQASKIESLWNPNLPKWIDRFIGEFAKRYRDTGVIQTVLLGIQGDFGEAIYSVTGGGWTFNIPGEYHNHQGFWCDDEYALADFRKFVRAKYKSTDAVNKAWGTSYAALDAIGFPGRKEGLSAFRASIPSGDTQVRRRWLDFIDWYRESMTRWSDYWIKTTRKHFPKTPIYLCTGGDAIPEHGSNFAEQCRVAAKHKGGVRITNEGSNYAFNFALTRWVASAGKHYGAYYGFEPAGPEDAQGIVARIYNATASGAAELHDYSPNVVNSAATVDVQRANLKHLFHTNPIVPVALWYPNVSLTLNWGGFLEKAAEFRDLLDFDYLDESMLATGALEKHRVLVVLHGEVMETADAKRIAKWVRNGGRLIVMGVPGFESVEGTAQPERELFGDTPDGRTLGKGAVVRVKDRDQLTSALSTALKELGLPVYDLKKDGVYVTQIAEDRFLYLTTGDSPTISEKTAGELK